MNGDWARGRARPARRSSLTARFGSRHASFRGGFLILATALACVAAPDSDAPDWTVRADGIGPLRVGMTLEEASRVLGEELRVAYADFPSCDHVRPSSLPGGVVLMIVNDTVVRVEVSDSSLTTSAAARVGMTEASLLEAYGARGSVTPHKYSGPEWHYVTIDADSAHAIVFETDGVRVQRFRAGRQPEVAWVEGCA